MLEGCLSPARIAERLKITPELVRSVQDRTEFVRLWEVAAKDMAVSGVDRIRAKVHLWVKEMEDLALLALDPQVRRAALTDLLNRAGTAPAAKLDLGPAAYRKAVDRYLEVEGEVVTEPKVIEPQPDPEVKYIETELKAEIEKGWEAIKAAKQVVGPSEAI